MRLNEQRLWDRMRKNLHDASLRLERVENLVGIGYPDVESIGRGHVSKVELKAVLDPPARPNTPLLGKKLGPTREQRNWMREWLEHGGRGFYLIGVGFGPHARQFLMSGALFDELESMPLLVIVDRALASEWREMREILRGEK